MQASWEVMGPEADVRPLLGVFFGIQQMEYGSLAAPHLQKMSPFTATGGPFSVAAGRLSYTYGLQGPAVGARLAAVICLQVICSGISESCMFRPVLQACRPRLECRS